MLGHSVARDSKQLAPLRHRQPLATVLDVDAAAAVVLLLLARCPSTVAGLVAPIVVNAVDR